uniref:Reverse transcriptase domain-containing protein n=1 Tax=Anopheles stephensi TaxID=30069 RepID=A0A182YTD2_ANOST
MTARRRLQRDRCLASREQLKATYVTTRSDLKREIKASKRRCFLELCAEIARKPCGFAYKTVMRKAKTRKEPVERCPEKLKGIIAQLFPEQEPPQLSFAFSTPESVLEPITIDEVLKIAEHFKPEKAPGPDGIPKCSRPYCRAL